MKTIIFRPTNNCNLACKYCYDEENHEKSIKLRENATNKFLEKEDMLIEGIYKILEEEKEPRMIFHGGEPLLVKSEVLDEFCTRLKEKKNIRYSIQTNGTLINEKTIDFFQKHHFHVGISLDGCNEKQNHARIYKNHKNSFQTVYKKMKQLQEKEISSGIIMSISKNHLQEEQKLYDFIGDNNFYCNIRPVFNANKEFRNNILTEEEYAEFFKRLFDIWFDDSDKKVETRQIYELYEALREELDPYYKPKLCNSTSNCFRNFISLDVDGELHSCNRLYGIEKFHYGNIQNMTMDEIMEKIKKLEKERREGVQKKCGHCERMSICNGGCVAESYEISNKLEDVSCDKKVKTLIKNHIKRRISND